MIKMIKMMARLKFKMIKMMARLKLEADWRK
jgi:hypothetical protein